MKTTAKTSRYNLGKQTNLPPIDSIYMVSDCQFCRGYMTEEEEANSEGKKMGVTYDL